MAEDEDGLFSQVKIPDENEVARLEEAKERLKKFNQKLVFETTHSIRDDLNELQKLKSDLGVAKSKNKVSFLFELFCKYFVLRFVDFFFCRIFFMFSDFIGFLT